MTTRETAQETADRENYPVHIGCGGECELKEPLASGPWMGGEYICHKCNYRVSSSSIAAPTPDQGGEGS